MNDSYFTRKIFYRFLVPSLLSSFCLAIANLADALCLGIRMGEPALAAISLVSPIYMVFNVLDIGIAIGGSVVFTRLMGEGRVKAAGKVFHQMIFIALAVSISIATLGILFLEPLLVLLGTAPEQGAVYDMTKDYAERLLIFAPTFFFNFLFYYFVRCDDGEVLAGVGFAVANLLDVGLSFVLVLIFNMGVKGAIWATIIGNLAGILIFLSHFFRNSGTLCLKWTQPDWKEIFACYRTGFSTSSQYIYQFVFFLVLNNLLMRRHGEGALAVFNVTLNLSYVIMGLYDGVSATVQPLAATFFGERNYKAQQYSWKLSLCWGLVLGSVMTVPVVFFAKSISVIFGLSEQMLEMGAVAVRWYCAGSLFAGFSVMRAAYFQAIGQENQIMLLTLMRSFLVYLFFSIVLAFGPLKRFWMVFPLTEICSLLLFWGIRMFRKKKHIVEAQEEKPVLHRILQNGMEGTSALLLEVEEFCEKLEASFEQTYFVTMAVEEMCLSILQHANQSKQKEVFIQITLFHLNDGQFEMHIRDNGEAFDPFSLRTSLVTEDESTLDALGILMVKKKAKEFFYRHYQGFNTLTVRI